MRTIYEDWYVRAGCGRIRTLVFVIVRLIERRGETMINMTNQQQTIDGV